MTVGDDSPPPFTHPPSTSLAQLPHLITRMTCSALAAVMESSISPSPPITKLVDMAICSSVGKSLITIENVAQPCMTYTIPTLRNLLMTTASDKPHSFRGSRLPSRCIAWSLCMHLFCRRFVRRSLRPAASRPPHAFLRTGCSSIPSCGRAECHGAPCGTRRRFRHAADGRPTGAIKMCTKPLRMRIMARPDGRPCLDFPSRRVEIGR